MNTEFKGGSVTAGLTGGSKWKKQAALEYVFLSYKLCSKDLLVELDGWILLWSLKGSEQNFYSRAFQTVIGGSPTYASIKDFTRLILLQGIIDPFTNIPL